MVCIVPGVPYLGGIIPLGRVMLTNHAACAYLALGVMITYFERNGFAVAITAASDSLGYPQSVKGNIMSLFFVTYLSTHIVGGALARRYGGLFMLRRMTAGWALLALISPFEPGSLALLRICRLGIGMTQGFVFPALHTLLAEMTTPATRGRVVSLVVSSIYLGSAVSMVSSPTLVALHGPASQTRAAATLALAWLAMSTVVPWPATDRERVLRLASSQSVAQEQGGRCAWAADVPWLSMARHPAVLAMMFASFTSHVVVFFMMSWVPTFVTVVLGQSLSGSGLSQAAQAAPWLLMYAVAVAAGSASDALAARIGIRTARKAVCVLGMLSCAPSLLLVPYARTPAELSALSALVLMTSGFSRGGWSINHLDIGPAFAGVLQGYAGTMGNFAGVVATRLPGWMLSSDATDRAVWHRIARVFATLCVLAGGAFALFAEGDIIFRERPHAPGDDDAVARGAGSEDGGGPEVEVGPLGGGGGGGRATQGPSCLKRAGRLPLAPAPAAAGDADTPSDNDESALLIASQRCEGDPRRAFGAGLGRSGLWPAGCQ
ncbi:hypothetical protein KFE25_011728 [Diacronema lutheri]|uniref:Major facilitator superfamily (MFS) profile domain-containing protein n=1 Tax=Diacronema lutheri TaxID=2081491 RepID=A0A8J6C0U4_DIALT|nr:hypothetical protein KFE25_011728 [Diacronema lutheri]